MIYFVQSGDENGPIKIGYSKNTEQRLAALQCSSPYKLTLLGTMPGDRVWERYIHSQFEAFQATGEWFRPHPRLLQFIGRACKMVIMNWPRPNFGMCCPPPQPQWARQKRTQGKRSEYEMNTKLTQKAQGLVNELAANGINLQNLAPIVGRAAEFAADAGCITVEVSHIQQAIKEKEADRKGESNDRSKARKH